MLLVWNTNSHISIWCSGNSWKILTTNQFLVSTFFFTNKNILHISFFILYSYLFSIIVKKVNQTSNSPCCSSPCFCVLLCTHYRSLQCFSTCFRKSKEIGVLRSIFPGYVISCDCFNFWNRLVKYPESFFCLIHCLFFPLL